MILGNSQYKLRIYSLVSNVVCLSKVSTDFEPYLVSVPEEGSSVCSLFVEIFFFPLLALNESVHDYCDKDLVL